MPEATAKAIILPGTSSLWAKLVTQYKDDQYTSSEFQVRKEQEVLLPMVRCDDAVAAASTIYVALKTELVAVGSFSSRVVTLSPRHYLTNQTEMTLSIRERILFGDPGDTATFQLGPHSSLPLPFMVTHEHLELLVHRKEDHLANGGAKQTWYPFFRSNEGQRPRRIYVTDRGYPLTLSYKTVISSPASENLVIYR